MAVAGALAALRTAPHVAVAVLGVAVATAADAAASVNHKLGASLAFDIPAQPLGASLKQLAAQAGIQIFYEERIVAGLQAPEIKAQLRIYQALDMLLRGTELEFVASNETVAVRRKPESVIRQTSLSEDRSSDGVARTAQAQPAAAEPSAPEELIVTARRREESFLDVPVIANIVTQQELERTKMDDVFALATRVPNLLMGNGVGATGVQVSLRGIGSTATNPTMDNSISLNVDGIQLSQGTAYGVGMFDVAQVEVLKGPQALFFGKNSPAGVISLRSADPTDAFETMVRVGYEHEAEEKEGELILSGPVSESLKLRLAARYSDHEGFFENKSVATPGSGAITPASRKYAPAEEIILRGTALWTPTDTFQARLKLNYSESQVTGGASPFNQVAYCPDGTGPVPGTNIAFLADEDCKADGVIRRPWFDPAAFTAGLPNDGVPFEDNEQMLGSLELNWLIDERLDVTSVTGFYDSAYDGLMQGTTSSTTQLLGNMFGFDNEQFTQELRFTSDFDGPVNFMTGAFYQEGEMRSRLRLAGNTRFNLAPILQNVLNEVDIRSLSLFGQALWDITPQLELAIGARWTDEEREHREFNYNPAQGPLGAVPRIDPKISSSNVSPELTLTYQPLDTLTVFGSYKRGFKSGSFSGLAYTPPTTPASFDDEKVEGGELGLKTATSDRRLTASAAVYYFRYTDLQVGALELSTIGNGNVIPLVRTLNAASATVKGIELESAFSPAAVDGLTLNAALNYNHARYRSFPNAPCGNGQTIAQGCDQLLIPSTGRYTAQDMSGRRLVRAPDWSGYLGFTQELTVGERMTLTFGAGASYASEYSTVLVDLPGFEQDAYVKVDANIGLRTADDRWDFSLVGRNLNNEYTMGRCANDNAQNGQLFGGQISGGVTGGPAGQDEASCFVERGRQLWARVSFTF